MKVVILGAGIIGVTTAYELLRAGHEVSIIDRQSEPAMETSFGNAGLIAPGHSYAWTTPKLPGNLFKSLFQRQRAFRFKFHWDPAMWRWGLHFLYQCTHKRMAENTLRKHRLCSYSQKCFHKLVDETLGSSHKLPGRIVGQISKKNARIFPPGCAHDAGIRAWERRG